MILGVALRKESVDRNTNCTSMGRPKRLSLSARRAWIEMSTVIVILRKRNTVALRKESVDRNFYYSDKDADWVRSLSARRAWIEIWTIAMMNILNGSLSARRAWIEIPVISRLVRSIIVALRKESVDRNFW